MDRRNLILTSEANENKGSILGPFSLNLVKLIHRKSNFSTLRIFLKKWVILGLFFLNFRLFNS